MSDENQGGGGPKPPEGPSKRRRRRRKPRRRPPAEGGGKPADGAPAEAGSAAGAAGGREPQPEGRGARGEGPAGQGEGRSSSGRRRRRRRRKPRDEGRPEGAAPRTGGAPDEQQSSEARARRRRRRPGRKRRGTREATAAAQDGAAADAPAETPVERGTEEETLVSIPAEDGWDFIEEGGETYAELTGEVPTVNKPEPAAAAADASPPATDDEPEPEGPDRSLLPSVLDPPLAEPGDDDIFVALEQAEQEGEAAPRGTLRNVAVIRLGLRGDRVQEFDAGELSLQRADQVVVETERGLAVGVVAQPPMRRPVGGDLPRLLRRIDANDERQLRRNDGRQQEAFEFCRERIGERNLPMKLIRVEYLHSGNKALFYFSAEHRIDFRELVRDLARHLRVRVEMRQVGVRDAAAMTGGIGSCGQQLCCARFLQKFDPVSIRMAKDQNLVLNPTKVSGQCGRLKCCLGYEQKLYQKARRKLPKVGARVDTPNGAGRVRELDVLRQLVRVQHQDGSIETHAAAEVKTQPREGQPRDGQPRDGQPRQPRPGGGGRRPPR